jgi:hypothetical protein
LPQKKQIQVSVQLLAFIEKEFRLMVDSEKELKKDRTLYRRDLERKEQREFIRMKRKHGMDGKDVYFSHTHKTPYAN